MAKSESKPQAGPTPQGHLPALKENEVILLKKISERIPNAHYADEGIRNAALKQAKRQLKEVQEDIKKLEAQNA